MRSWSLNAPAWPKGKTVQVKVPDFPLLTWAILNS